MQRLSRLLNPASLDLSEFIYKKLDFSAKMSEPAEIEKLNEKLMRLFQVVVHARVHFGENTDSLTSKDRETLLTTLLNDAQELEFFGSTRFLGEVLRLYCGGLSDSAAQPSDVLDRLKTMCEEQRKVSVLKNTFDQAILNYESAKRRHEEELSILTKKELKEAETVVKTLKVKLEKDMFALAESDASIAKLFEQALKIQIQNQQQSTLQMQTALAQIHTKILEHGFDKPVLSPSKSYETLDKMDLRGSTCVFGIPLHEHLESTKREIATALEVCCCALVEFGGIKEEGILRISGQASSVKKLKSQLDQAHYNVQAHAHDPHTLAAVLKSYLRELPEPLMTTELHRAWQNVNDLPDDQKPTAVFGLLDEMPAGYKANLGYLMKFLRRIVQHEEENKMSAGNLALVIGPNLMWSSNSEDAIVEMMNCNRIVDYLITNADIFWPDGVLFTTDLFREVHKPISKSDRSSSLDSLLLLSGGVGFLRNTSESMINMGSMFGSSLKQGDKRKTSTGGVLKGIRNRTKVKRRAPAVPSADGDKIQIKHLSSVIEDHNDDDEDSEAQDAGTPTEHANDMPDSKSVTERTSSDSVGPLSPLPDECPFVRKNVVVIRTQSAKEKPALPVKPSALGGPLEKTKL